MEAGQTLGHYRLLEPLGEGGFGRVWRAVDLRLERQVAFKVLKGEDPEHQRLLVQEARTASQLHHPNVATIFDVGEVEGTSYLAMELVEGRSLKDLLGRPMAADLLLQVASQAASALHAAHQKGIVHRDIKPENLVLAEGGQIKILDFGVAKRAALGQDSTHQALTQTGATGPGLSSGTPAYMSPEQAWNRDVGPASDQFSLGLVLWELAAGRHPFRRGAVFETLHAIASEATPTLTRERPDLPPALLEGIHRMLAKAPEERFPDLADFREALERSPFRAAPAPPVRREPLRWRGPLLVLGILGLLAGGAGVVRWLRAPESMGGRRVVAVLPLDVAAEGTSGDWMGASFGDALTTGLLGQRDLMVLDRARVAEACARHGRPGGVLGLEALVRDLGADYLVMGSCLVQGDHLRVSLRLVEGRRGEVVRQAQVSGPRDRLLDLEDQLSQRVPTLLGLRREPREVAPASRARDPRTREAYARASEEVLKGTPEAYRAAEEHFERALGLEPDYAPAHAGLAWALLEHANTEIHLGRQASYQAMAERAEREAQRALGLDPSLAGAHRILGQVALHRGDLAAALKEGGRALELDPGDYRARVLLGNAEANRDDPEARARAREHFLRALELGPGDWFAHLRYGVFLQNEGDLREALAEANRAAALQPMAEYPHLCAAVCLLWLGETGQARGRAERALAEVPDSRLLKLTLALALYHQGEAPAFRSLERELAEAWPKDHVIRVLLQGLAADLEGRPEEMEALFEGYRVRAGAVDWGTRPLSDRRGTSVNLYHMARALALRGRRDRARAALDLAERLHPGKRKVAAQDPAFKS